MKPIAGPAVLVLACLSQVVFSQTELQENVRYESNTYLTISSLGISFIIPNGWYGGVASGSPYMVLADDSNEVTLIVAADELKESEVLSDLQQKISLDEGISLSPIGQVRQQGKRWWGDYKVNSAAQDMKCYVEVRLGNYGIGASCIVLSLPASFERGKGAAVNLLQTVTFREPQTASKVTVPGVPYVDYLKGKSLKYFYTEGDFSDTDLIHLCSNGTFIRSKSTLSGGITGTGSLHSANEGTWKATGQGAEGALTLNSKDGTRTDFKLQYRYGTKGIGLYLNGYRYYIEANTQCN